MRGRVALSVTKPHAWPAGAVRRGIDGGAIRMKTTCAFMIVCVALLAGSVYFFSQRGQLAAEAYRLGLDREDVMRETTAPDRSDEQRREARQPMFDIMDETGRVEVAMRNAAMLAIASAVFGIVAGTAGVLRLRRRKPVGGPQAT
jgi:hypothetical protein